MNPRKETQKAFEAFGTQLTIVSNNKKFKGLGIFNKLKVKKTQNLAEKINSYCKEKYSLWVFDYKHIKSIDTVIANNQTFETITGYYDKQIGCWRLVVQEKITETTILTNLDENDT